MKFSILLVVIIVVFGFTERLYHPQQWQSLFNGKDLSGWDTWLGPKHNEFGKIENDKPAGLNNDPDHVFTVIDLNGEKVIRISGNGWGGISTKNEYENYHLQLQFKWGNLKWHDKKGKKKDSGLLYHAVGEHGADYGAWMRSQEFQVQEGDCGDYWGVAGGMQDIQAVRNSDTTFIYDPSGPLIHFAANSKQGRFCIKRGDAEKPSGEWNTIDLYVHGDTSVHMVNGKTMMVLYHSSQWDNGQAKPLVKGKIQIQSEGAEVYYKAIRILSINSIPGEVMK